MINSEINVLTFLKGQLIRIQGQSLGKMSEIGLCRQMAQLLWILSSLPSNTSSTSSHSGWISALLVSREGRLDFKILYAFSQRLTETRLAKTRALNIKTRLFTPFPGAHGPNEGSRHLSSGCMQVSFDAQK